MQSKKGLGRVLGSASDKRTNPVEQGWNKRFYALSSYLSLKYGNKNKEKTTTTTAAIRLYKQGNPPPVLKLSGSGEYSICVQAIIPERSGRSKALIVDLRGRGRV